MAVANIREIRVDQEYTLVSKGITRSTYTPQTWIDTRQKGNASFFKISRIGTKYLYGNYIYFEENQKVIRDWESKIDPADYIIHKGIRHDLKQAHLAFINKLDSHTKLRENKRREIEREAQDLINSKIELWDKQNPRPRQAHVGDVEK